MLVRAARYLRVTPWELAEQPIAWLQWAIAAEDAEDYAAAAARKK